MRYKDENGEIHEITSHSKKLVLLLGAGATYADRANLKKKANRPPLDKLFFKNTMEAHKDEEDLTFAVSNYMNDIYDIDISEPENDSIERVFATIYTDVFNKNLEKKALKTFQNLVFLFNFRLAETTNPIQITKNLFLSQFFDHYLRKGYDPDNITIVTFNNDIQIEKILNGFQRSSRWNVSENICNFPSCYKMKVRKNQILIPNIVGKKKFDVKFRNKGITVLKLHGSINWYSQHKRSNPSTNAMFSPKREIFINPELSIPYSAKISGFYVLPVIVPPVFHKSAILHNKIKRIWNYAENAISNADEVLIFGYSCPATDVESENLLTRSFIRNEKSPKISIIDPDSNAVKRYLDLLFLKKICYYQGAQQFLDDVNN